MSFIVCKFIMVQKMGIKKLFWASKSISYQNIIRLFYTLHEGVGVPLWCRSTPTPYTT